MWQTNSRKGWYFDSKLIKFHGFSLEASLHFFILLLTECSGRIIARRIVFDFEVSVSWLLSFFMHEWLEYWDSRASIVEFDHKKSSSETTYGIERNSLAIYRFLVLFDLIGWNFLQFLLRALAKAFRVHHQFMSRIELVSTVDMLVCNIVWINSVKLFFFSGSSHSCYGFPLLIIDKMICSS